jgi:hypothetical protein
MKLFWVLGFILISQPASATERDIFGHLIFSSSEDLASEECFDKNFKHLSREEIGERDFSPFVPGSVDPIVSAGYSENEGEQVREETTVRGPFGNYAVLMRSAADSFEGSNMRLLQNNEYSVVLRDEGHGVLALTDWKHYSCGKWVIPILGEQTFSVYLGEMPSDKCTNRPSFTKDELKKAIEANLKKVWLRPGFKPEVVAFEKWKDHWTGVAESTDCQNKNCFSLTSVNLELQFTEGDDSETVPKKEVWNTFKTIKINRWLN